MSKRDALIEKYAAQMKDKLGMSPDMALLRAVTIACGPSIYNRDSSTVAGSDPSELATVRNGFMTKRLGMTDEGAKEAALNKVMDAYKAGGSTKYRAVVYYLLVKETGKESLFS
jgi:hypothetical protein